MLIAFEGIDAVGKSTQIRMLQEYIERSDLGRGVTCSFEPTRGPHGMRARRAALGEITLTIEEELQTFLDDKEEHAREVVQPALRDNRIVMLDRYYGSTMAYQSRSGRWSVEELRDRSEIVAQPPDLWVILDLPIAEALKRLELRVGAGQAAEIYERRDIQEHCREVFLSMAGEPNVAIISALGSPTDIHLKVVRAFASHYKS